MSKDNLSESLAQAFPPIYPANDFISRHEFVAALQAVESRIDNSELKLQKWMLSGIIAIMLTFGGGFLQIAAKLDRLGDTFAILDGRRQWMARKDQQDQIQDEALRQVKPDYVSPPFVPPPK